MKRSKIFAFFFILPIGIAALAINGFAQDRPPAGKFSTPQSAARMTAPGYCESFGGSVGFESISNVVVVENPDGTLTIKVDIRLTNPDGCVSGKPCPTYDINPENVNAWIDFDGDKQWEPNERVMDAALTGYANINYRGAMHTESVTHVPPNAVRPTWMRVNLGWGYDPNDPCQKSWSYGNVWDKEVFSTVKVGELWTQGDVPIQQVENPVWIGEYDKHGQFIKELKKAPAAWPLQFGKFSFQVFLLSFPASIGLTPKVECEYEFKNDRHSVRGTTSSFTGWSGAIFGGLPREIGKYNLSLKFKIFNQQNSLIATQTIEIPEVYITYYIPTVQAPGLTIPKKIWYEKAVDWAKGTSEPDKIATALMQSIYTKSGWIYNFATSKWQDLVEGATNEGQCGNIADVWVNLMKVLGVPGVSKVKHNTVVNGKPLWPGSPISRKGMKALDGQPGNAYQWTFNPFSSYDRWAWGSHVFGALGNRYYDPTLGQSFEDASHEFEWYFVPNAQGQTLTQIDEKGRTYSVTSGAKFYSTGRNITSGWPEYKYIPNAGANNLYALAKTKQCDVRFTGNFTEAPVDKNGDGIFDQLSCQVEVELLKSGLYGARSALVTKDSLFITSVPNDDAPFRPVYPIPDAPGIKKIDMSFSGEHIFAKNQDGPYLIEISLMDTSGTICEKTYFSTRAYQFRAFGEYSGRLGAVADRGVDTDGDGKFNTLQLSVSANVTRAASYRADASLWSGQTLIAQTSISSPLPPGNNEIKLAVSGSEIAAAAIDGPYALRLLLFDDNGIQTDRIDTVTAKYVWADFDPNKIALTGVYTDAGIDINGNALFDSLRVNVGMRVDSAGSYQIAAYLQNAKGENVTWRGVSRTLGAGTQTVAINFSGRSIYAQQTDGAYSLSYVVVSDKNNPIIVSKQNAYTTKSYAYAAFEPPSRVLVTSTGQYADQGLDMNGNGLYDALAIDAGVSVADSGNVWAIGRLVDASGEEITLTANSTFLRPGNAAAAARLLFDGRYIFGNRTNGRYQLKNLHVYHAGDPEQEIVVQEAYTTKAYQYTEFEKAASIAGIVTDSLGAGVENTLLLIPAGDFDYTNKEGKYNLVALRDSTYTLKIQGADSTLKTWSIFVNGQFVGRRDSVRVPVSVGNVAQVNFRSNRIIVAPVQATLKQFSTGTGTTFAFPVEVSDLTGKEVYAADLTLSYNADLLKAVGATTQGTIAQSFGSPVFNITPGQIQIAMAGTAALTGSGVLVYVNFEVIGAKGNASVLRFVTMTLNEGNPPVDTQNGLLTIANTPPTAPRLFEPGNGSVLNTLNPTFKWSPSNDADQSDVLAYVLLMGTDTLNLNRIQGAPTGQDTLRYKLAGNQTLQRATRYFWRIETGDGEATTRSAVYAFRTSDTATRVEGERSALPTIFALHQNHPNPFNPETLIRYELPHAVKVQLTIYNILGQPIRQLVDHEQAPGAYEMRWDGRDAAGRQMGSGIYFYQITAGPFRAIRKMLIVQ